MEVLLSSIDFYRSNLTSPPIIRIFGRTRERLSVLAHVHGYLPFVCFQLPEKFLKIQRQQLFERIKEDFETLGNRQGHEECKIVQKVEIIYRIPFYGYHEEKKPFVKVTIYDPNLVPHFGRQLLKGMVLATTLQPYEAHISYIMNFLIEHELSGMSFVKFTKFTKREYPQNRANISSFLMQQYSQTWSLTCNAKNSKYSHSWSVGVEIDVHCNNITAPFAEQLKQNVPHFNKILIPGLEIWKSEALLMLGKNEISCVSNSGTDEIIPERLKVVDAQIICRMQKLEQWCSESTPRMSQSQEPLQAETDVQDKKELESLSQPLAQLENDWQQLSQVVGMENAVTMKEHVPQSKASTHMIDSEDDEASDVTDIDDLDLTQGGAWHDFMTTYSTAASQLKSSHIENIKYLKEFNVMRRRRRPGPP